MGIALTSLDTSKDKAQAVLVLWVEVWKFCSETVAITMWMHASPL